MVDLKPHFTLNQQRRYHTHYLLINLVIFCVHTYMRKCEKLLVHFVSHTHTHTQIYMFIHTHTNTGCPGRNVPDFGRMFLKLKYTDITQNTYVQS